MYGALVQMLTNMQGTPLAYNKAIQEDKEGLYDVIDTWKASITIFANMLEKTEFRMDRIEQHFAKGFLNATDIAEHFANAGIPFREAHSIVGRMVKMCEARNCDFEDLTEAIPAYLCLIAMPLMYSISEGIAIGVISYVVINVICGKRKKITPLMYVLAVLFICKYIFL